MSMKKARKFPTVEEMNRVADLMRKQFPGTGYCILSFDFHAGGYIHYRTNANLQDMARAMEEFIKNFKDGKTPIPPKHEN